MRQNDKSLSPAISISKINFGNSINFSLKDPNAVIFVVYDIQGQRIYDGNQETSSYFIHWNGRNYEDDIVPSGVYFYLVKTEENIGFFDVVLLR